MRKTLLILGMLGAGLLLPSVGDYTAVIRPFLMIMLFFSFLKVRLGRELFRWVHLRIALVAPILAGVAYFGLAQISEPLARNVFLIVLAPTAVVTPVLVDILRGNVPYAIGGILVTHAVWAGALALYLPWVSGSVLNAAELATLLFEVGSLIGLPLLAAQFIRRGGGARVEGVLNKLGGYTLYLFLTNILIAAGRLSQYLRYEATVELDLLYWIAGAMIIVCATLFPLGARLGPPTLRTESSLLLGRKNTMISIWVALTYLSPLATIGPMVYILVQNVWFAGQVRGVGR